MEQTALDFYRGMSNYELQDAIHSSSSFLIELYTLCLTVIFAYLVVAFLVGKQLTKLQLFSISIIYSVFLLILIVIVYQTIGELYTRVGVRQGFEGVNFWLHILVPLLFLGSWLLSLIFMNHSRSQGDT